jgi:hypothetical protein
LRRLCGAHSTLTAHDVAASWNRIVDHKQRLGHLCRVVERGGTRFGQTAQIHRVAFPGGAREQLTFYDEPIADALARPGKADRFLFQRDTGGAEYFQIYSSPLAGKAKTITEPGNRSAGIYFFVLASASVVVSMNCARR